MFLAWNVPFSSLIQGLLTQHTAVAVFQLQRGGGRGVMAIPLSSFPRKHSLAPLHIQCQWKDIDIFTCIPHNSHISLLSGKRLATFSWHPRTCLILLHCVFKFSGLSFQENKSLSVPFSVSIKHGGISSNILSNFVGRMENVLKTTRVKIETQRYRRLN